MIYTVNIVKTIIFCSEKERDDIMFLGSEEIKKLIKEKNLVSDFINLKEQLQPNGFDLTLQNIERVTGHGTISASGKVLPILEKIPIKSDNTWILDKGVYIITFNEVLKFPKGIAGISIQRSSVIRCGAMINVSLWDSGYEGRGQNLLVVHSKYGLTLQKNVRIVQVQFIKIMGKNYMYRGNYQHENIHKL